MSGLNTKYKIESLWKFCDTSNTKVPRHWTFVWGIDNSEWLPNREKDV